jgi:hypothetical protein
MKPMIHSEPIFQFKIITQGTPRKLIGPEATLAVTGRINIVVVDTKNKRIGSLPGE